MSKKLVEYKLERYPVCVFDGKNYKMENQNMVPVFIEDGGYLSLNDKMIGVTFDSSNTHVPSSLIQPSRQDLKDRAASIGLKKFENDEYVDMNTQEISDYIDAFLLEKGFENLA